MTAKINDDPQSNPAVLRCLEFYSEAYSAHAEEDERFALDEARAAYRQAMPPLLGLRNIRNFLVSATHGFSIGAIDGAEYSRYLYAVQVAYSAHRLRLSMAPKNKKPHSDAIKGGKNAVQEPFSPPVETTITDSPAIT